MDSMINLQEQLCAQLQDLEIANIYEHLKLSDLFVRLGEKYKITSVLEYQGLKESLGRNNIFWPQTAQITVCDRPEYMEQVNAGWFARELPEFLSQEKLEKSGRKFDLVWNNAQIQIKPEIFEDMKEYSQKYILLVVPNYFNWGTPFHLLGHWLFRKPCQHKGRGFKRLSHRAGLRNFLLSQGVKILKEDYLACLLRPNIGFSTQELKRMIGLKSSQSVAKEKLSGYQIKEKAEKMINFEKRKFFLTARSFFYFCEL